MQTIHLDISNKGNIPTIYAKQGDVGRKFLIVITDAGIPRPIEDGEAFSVWYEGASGVGNYTDIGGESAFSIEGNTVTIEMIAQMLNNAGDGNLCLIMTNTDGDQVGTWNIPYIAEEVPGLGSKPAEQHLNALVDAQKRAESSAIDAMVYAQEASMYQDEAKNWAEAAEDAANRAESAGGGGGGSVNAVLYAKQTLTEEQKAQARENIGAINESGAIDCVLSQIAGGYKQIKEMLIDNTLAFTAWNNRTSIISAIDDTVTFTPTIGGSVGVAAYIDVDFSRPLKIKATTNLDASLFNDFMVYVFVNGGFAWNNAIINTTKEFSVDLSKYSTGKAQIIFAVQAKDNNIGEPITISAVRAWQETEKFVVDTGFDEEDVLALVDNANNHYHIAPNGDRYLSQVSADGNLVMTPVVPSKALFIGNSLLIGFGFGMAASDSQHDYYYLINQAITAQKSNYTASKMSGTAWEGATKSQSQETFLNDTLLPKLSNDLELVVVQLGDNVNTDEKKAVFADGSRRLLEFIRTNCPKARVVWVGAWYQTAEKQAQMEDACRNTGCTFVDIWDLATTENKSAVGNTYTDENGNVQTITSAGVASHPGDAGFKAIANRVLYKLGIVDTENYY